MRPRNEPPPEPADLFRAPAPSADQKPDRPHPLAPDGTVVVGSARAAADASGLSPATPLAGPSDGKKAKPARRRHVTLRMSLIGQCGDLR